MHVTRFWTINTCVFRVHNLIPSTYFDNIQKSNALGEHTYSATFDSYKLHAYATNIAHFHKVVGIRTKLYRVSYISHVCPMSYAQLSYADNRKKKKWIEFLSFSQFSSIHCEFVVGRFRFCNWFCRNPPLSWFTIFHHSNTQWHSDDGRTRVPFYLYMYYIGSEYSGGEKKKQAPLNNSHHELSGTSPPLRYVTVPHIISLYTHKCNIISPDLCFLPPIRPSNESRIDRYAAIVL